ncbi:hypothetical protein OG322_38245 [Streptomyces sp. NBC_01260]|uniref:hypothetical protein n=1 Tax=unclassified Streptomyces TaxID=2593676 RepID=UPI000F46F547|nr:MULTISPECIES: hypothetical protein [unclassified Streptomyces]ROQ78011.1 hypothetical protein EDD95_4578 [Streptomyces sp. CEV 2-1]RPK38309.1 hypothetical protein EES39_29195 [Streptomyces sp. ADI92-24]
MPDNGTVLVMDAVVETYDAVDFALWPTAPPRADRLLALSGRMSPPEVGTAMAVLTSCGHDDADDSAPDSEAGVRRVQDLLGVDLVIAPGGILLRDTAADVAIAPGCCFGLENWRDWLGLMAGEEIWLGHGTATHIEHLESLVRLWPDTAPPARAPIELPLAELPDLLQSVHDKLNGFLDLAGQWAARYALASAPALIAKLDEDLDIGTPLPTKRVRNASTPTP